MTPTPPAEGIRDVRVTINGVERRVKEGTPLLALLEELGVDVARIAVERNRAVVPRGEHAALRMAEGDAYEVVQFVGGG